MDCGGTRSPRGPRLTLVVHEASAELLEGSSVAHGPERAVELVVGHHQVLRVPRHVDDLECERDTTAPQRAEKAGVV